MEKNASVLLAELTELIKAQAIRNDQNLNTTKACYFESLLKNITESRRSTSEVIESWIRNLSSDLM